MVKSFILVSLVFFHCFESLAQESQRSQELNLPMDFPYESSDKDSIWSHVMKKANRQTTSDVAQPVVSYLLPGFAQFLNGQTGAGLFYSGLAAVGLGVGASAVIELGDDPDREERLSDLDSFDPVVRRYVWGLKTYDLAGSLSLYHSFQTSARFLKTQGRYQFLPAEAETTDELMLAPFDFSNLNRWSTLLPLVAGLGLAVAVGSNDGYNTRSLNSGDLAFASGLSYNAGVGEEALFRGWMFPRLVEWYGVENLVWANITQAALFGAAHFSDDNPFPVFQLAAGFYFGWLAQKNAWSLKEAIFVHTWWDVIVFTAAFTQGDRKASLYIPLYQTQF